MRSWKGGREQGPAEGRQAHQITVVNAAARKVAADLGCQNDALVTGCLSLQREAARDAGRSKAAVPATTRLRSTDGSVASAAVLERAGRACCGDVGSGGEASRPCAVGGQCRRVVNRACRKGCGQSAAYASEAMPRPTRCRQPERGGARRVRRGEDGVFAAEGCEAVEDRCG